ncbi:MAG: LysR family transcriptional regulator [Eubacteriales bacterium]|nr:LysR family transcriptional regulator [Eubacteriales bacterium]
MLCCHISQSAISQQVRALERELGFNLFERETRKVFRLTPAGEHFYKKSLVLVADFDRMYQESLKIARGKDAALRIGYLRTYSGEGFRRALELFTKQYPEVAVSLAYGNHEELYQMLISGKVDLALNDQRRKFSDAYENQILEVSQSCIEISARSPLASLPEILLEDLKSTPCILVASKGQEEIEREYYTNIIGFHGEFLFADHLEAARLMVMGGRGFLLSEGNGSLAGFEQAIVRIPLCRGEEPMTRNYCAFWPKGTGNIYVEPFAEILKAQY